jgi:hypothetical protein
MFSFETKFRPQVDFFKGEIIRGLSQTEKQFRFIIADMLRRNPFLLSILDADR